MFSRRLLWMIAGLACLQAPLAAHAQTARPPTIYTEREIPERDYTPKTYTHRNLPPVSRPSQNRAAPLKSVHVQPRQEQPKHAWTKAPPREPELARCDDLRRRYENAMRAESRTAAERQAIYQQQVQAGC